MVQEMTKNFLPFVFKTKLENVTNHYPTQFRMLHLLTLMCRADLASLSYIVKLRVQNIKRVKERRRVLLALCPPSVLANDGHVFELTQYAPYSSLYSSYTANLC